ncbi:NAD-dependent epimerase/dehydratase family protein [Undibacterium sp. Ren11W]|uniref:NAD-dependent epimerase/dehydratase family protein n=1 Tax=Undibacterium sp. Ren11W TaxID=3413045 RepID=UPI003BF0CC55
MHRKILVIGGTRFFGKILVQELLQRGHHVTLATRGNTVMPVDLNERLAHIQVDRGDAAAMHAAFSDSAGFDIVYDQVCYHPLDAQIACQVFLGKVGRYIMTSTIEVYADQYPQGTASAQEDLIDLQDEHISLAFPWRDAAFAEANYGYGKHQAEAYFTQNAAFPFVSVRCAHVYAAMDEFTGRFAHYAALVQQQAPFAYSAGMGKTSFISAPDLAAYLLWIGEQNFVGPINAAGRGCFSALDLYEIASGQTVPPAHLLQAQLDAHAPSNLSPFDYPHDYVVSTQRATNLGYVFADNQAQLTRMFGVL